jgi:VWFA-related protein
MMHRALRTLVMVGALAIPGSSAALEGAPDQAPPPKFTSSVDVVSVTAIVRDRKGRFVRDLGRKDFVVAEAGEPRPILDFRSESDGPIKLAILFDISGSMRLGSKAVDARQAARHLLSALRPSDEAALFVFDTQLERVSGFTSDVRRLDSALDHVDPPYGQTSLYDAVARTAGALADEDRGHGRLQQRIAVVVLTDGIDTRSRLTPSEVSAVASNIDIPVYVLAVMSSIDDPREALADANGPVDTSRLRDLSQWTGGELFTASAPAHASVAARQIVDELRHQYVLAFEASARAGWRSLEIRARDRALVVRARSGYTAGSGADAVDSRRQGDRSPEP